MLCISCSGETEQIKEIVSKTRIKAGVYKDNSGVLYFKVLNPYDSNDLNKPEHIFLKEVYIDDDFIPLNKIVDISTIKRINDWGLYFIDKKHAYIHINGRLPSGQRRFSAVKDSGAETFGKLHRYLRTKKTYYFRGLPIFDLDIKTAKFIAWSVPKHNKTIEFIKDKSGYYYGRHKLTLEFLCRVSFSEKVKTAIIQEILGKKNGKAEDCK